MTDKTIVVGDIGALIEMDVGEDITTATEKSLRVKKPDGNVVIWSASLSGQQLLQYTTVEGDIDQAGVYTVNPKVVLAGFDGHGLKDTFYAGEPGDV